MLRYALISLGIVLVGIVLLVTLVLAPSARTSVEHTRETPAFSGVLVSFGTTTIRATVADIQSERTKGLSGRASLGEYEGMLFVFEQPALYTFWMPDMRFALDIIWLDDALRVVTIKENATPESYPEAYAPTRPARYVLEVRSGFARAHGIREGAQALLK